MKWIKLSIEWVLSFLFKMKQFIGWKKVFAKKKNFVLFSEKFYSFFFPFEGIKKLSTINFRSFHFISPSSSHRWKLSLFFFRWNSSNIPIRQCGRSLCVSEIFQLIKHRLQFRLINAYESVFFSLVNLNLRDVANLFVNVNFFIDC